MKAETAKEFLLKQYKQTFGTHYEQSSLKHLYEKVIIKAMIEYAESKCTEQRQFCANYYIIRKANEKCNDTISFEDIMNAPKPDFK